MIKVLRPKLRQGTLAIHKVKGEGTIIGYNRKHFVLRLTKTGKLIQSERRFLKAITRNLDWISEV